MSASTIAYRRADTWVRPYGWSRAHPSPARQGRGGSNPRLQAGTAASTIAYRRADTWVTRGSAPTAGHARIPLPPVRGGGQTRAYRRERLSASNIAYRRADTWVTRGSAPTAGHARIPLPPVRGGGSNPRLQAGTVVRQQHCLPAGGHVGNTWVRPYGWSRAHPPHPIPHPRRAGERGFQTRAYRRERLSASTIAYRRADTWVRPYGWSRAHPPHPIPHPPVKGEGVKPAPTGGNGCPPAPSPTGGRTRGSIVPTNCHFSTEREGVGRAVFVLFQSLKHNRVANGPYA